MSDGGSQTSSTQSIPGWLQSAGQGYLQNAQNVAQQPYQPYDRQRVADLSPIQKNSIQGIGDLAGGTSSQWAANDMLTNTLQGGFQNPNASRGVDSGGQYQPPWVGSGGQNYSAQVGGGGQYQAPYVDAGGRFQARGIDSGGQYQADNVNAGFNPYQGENPYFRQSMQAGLDDIGRNYREFTKPGLDAAAVLNGTFGGGDHRRLQGQTDEALAREMSRFSSGLLNDQYNRSAGLAESGLSRQLQAGQFNANLGSQNFENAAQRGMRGQEFGQGLEHQSFESAAQRGLQAGTVNANLGNQAFENAAQRGLQADQFNVNRGGQDFENAAQRGLQAGQFNASLGNQSFENAAQRGLNAGQFNANLGSSAYENERNRQMQAVTGATGLATGASQNLQGALNAGDIERRQNQSLLDSQYGDFREWRDYPERQLGIYGGALGNLLGRSGGSTTTQGPGADRVGQGLGMWQLANSMGEKGGNGNAFSGSYGSGDVS